MGFTSFTTAELSVDKGIKSTVIVKIRDNLEWARNAFQYNLTEIPNRGFEYQTEGVPALWDCTTYEDGIIQVTSSTSYEGENSLMLIHDGGTRSGGEAISDYFPLTTMTGNGSASINSNRWGDTTVNFNLVMIFYNGSFGVISSVVTTANALSTAPSAYNQTSFLKPANTRWGKLKIKTSTAAAATVAGTVYFDNLAIVGE